jgi:Tfp pilus assembly protein PilV
MDMPQPNSKSAGITLVGILVATFILAAGAIAVSRLTGSAERFTGVGREITIATNLSREGLELIRAVRDTNWFSDETADHWLDRGICSGNGQDSSEKNRQLTIEPDTVRLGDTLGLGDTQLYINSNGAFTHKGGSKTLYKRVVSVDCSTKDDEPQFVTVTSSVTWNSRNLDREVVLKERLYNWLPGQSTPAPTP